MEPDFDDDDLINDDYDEAPPGYEEDEYLEQMAMENDGEAAAGASSNATPAANITTENISNINLERNSASDMIDSMRMNEQEEAQHDGDNDDEMAETSANVRQAYARRREGKKNLFTFERYVRIRAPAMDVSLVSS
jgi:phytoene/squalene synthetase